MTVFTFFALHLRLAVCMPPFLPKRTPRAPGSQARSRHLHIDAGRCSGHHQVQPWKGALTIPAAAESQVKSSHAKSNQVDQEQRASLAPFAGLCPKRAFALITLFCFSNNIYLLPNTRSRTTYNANARPRKHVEARKPRKPQRNTLGGSGGSGSVPPGITDRHVPRCPAGHTHERFFSSVRFFRERFTRAITRIVMGEELGN